MKETHRSSVSKKWSEGKYLNIGRRLGQDEEESMSTGRNYRGSKPAHLDYGYYSSGGWASTNALYNKLEKSLGIEWNKVYSELVQGVKGLGKYYRYTLDETLDWMVELHPIVEDDGLGYYPEYSYRSTPISNFFVYPEAINGGVLCKNSREGNSRRKKSLHTITELEIHGVKHVFRYGSWYLENNGLYIALNAKEMSLIYKEFPNARKHYENY
jgi:hypothetical protein